MKYLRNLEQEVSRFYLLLWLRWAVGLSTLSVLLAVLVSAGITLSIYVNQGMKELSVEVVTALSTIFEFWFAISCSVTILLSLFLTLKYVFNKCYAHFQLNLLTCPNDDGESYAILEVGYGDLVKVWRKWLMLLIWLIGAQMIFAVIFMKLFSVYAGVFEWFSVYILYIFLLIAGYFSFIILTLRCKKVRVVKC